MRFSATIVERPAPGRPGLWVGFVLPAEVVEHFAPDAMAHGRRRIPVVVSARGKRYRSSIFLRPDGWEFIASLAFRAQTGLEPGAAFDGEIELDATERVVDVPLDLANALELRPGAREAWDRLPYSHQREIVMYIEDAKREDTRLKRVTLAVDTVLGKRT